ncbi:hypothetical protein MPTK1_6g15350 [Marchantia polymorpha subsp. ruderalis]|nr:hypothetical protein MARPO_0056s0047 [Marchantia polymorpha]BBN14892.1 hypothetical protein Mp_6g15350 [Marchantia polymorpha subsp. ruderalis]|eukprot:PTQ37576.1 hypothetical protein MARPO_0056s0047 [Marchantia polymorpha]
MASASSESSKEDVAKSFGGNYKMGLAYGLKIDCKEDYDELKAIKKAMKKGDRQRQSGSGSGKTRKHSEKS